MKIACLTTAVVSALALAPGLAGAAVDTGELLRDCIACHAADGTAITPKTPHLNGQLPKYLAFAMLSFQVGARPTAVPKHVPKTLSPAQMQAIAEHYAGSTAARPRQVVDAGKLAQGERVYKERCAECHPDNGRATDLKGIGTPIIAAQPAEYLLAQARLYVSGERRYLEARDKAHAGLTDSDLAAVSHFFASQSYPGKAAK